MDCLERNNPMAFEYFLTIGTFVGFYTILSLGLNFIYGYAGQPHLGYAAIYGIGAYSSAILATRLGLSFWLTFPLTIVITAGIGLILCLPSLRLKEDFFCIATIGINLVVVEVFMFAPFFGATNGIANIPSPTIFGQPISSGYYVILVLIVVVACIVIHQRFASSWLGLACKAIAEDERTCEVIGINVTKLKIIAFLMSSAFAGIAGSLYAHYMGFIYPTDFGFDVSILVLVMMMLGGSGTTAGPILGAVLLTVLPEALRFVSDYRLMVYGLMLTALMLFQPSGLIGSDSYLRRKLASLTKGSQQLAKK